MKSVTRKNVAEITEAAWAVALRYEAFGYAEIAADLKISLEQATKIVRGWDREAAIQPVQAGVGLRKLWRADRDFVRPEPRRVRSAEENMWFTMRKLRSFTPSDLAAHSTTDVVTVAVEDASAYCRLLLSAGYVRPVRKAAPLMKREAIYNLVRDTGPRPPVERRVRALIDPNTEDTIFLGGMA